MHYILHVHLDQFYIASLLREDRSLATRPLIVHRDKAVLDASDAALCLGVCPGMAFAEAKRLLLAQPGSSLFAWEEDRFRAAQERWLDVCAETSDIVEPETQHSAFLDLSVHPAPFGIAESLKRDLHARGGVSARLGMARCKWIAKLACEHLGNMACNAEWHLAAREAVEAQDRFLSSFATDCLLPILPEHRRRLIFLGYRTIGEVAEIPMAVMKDQFSEHAPLIRAAARGGVFEKVLALYPCDKARARMVFEGGAESIEALQQGQIALAKKIAKTLRRLDSQGSLLELRIEYESGKTEERKRRFAKPISDARTVLSALRLLLGETFPEPIVSISAFLPGLKKIVRSQLKLSGDASESARPTNLENSFCAIRTVFGDKAVQVAGDIAQSRRIRVLKAWKEATGWL